jgi:hypothetical protein
MHGLPSIVSRCAGRGRGPFIAGDSVGFVTQILVDEAEGAQGLGLAVGRRRRSPTRSPRAGTHSILAKCAAPLTRSWPSPRTTGWSWMLSLSRARLPWWSTTRMTGRRSWGCCGGGCRRACVFDHLAGPRGPDGSRAAGRGARLTVELLGRAGWLDPTSLAAAFKLLRHDRAGQPIPKPL